MRLSFAAVVLAATVTLVSAPAISAVFTVDSTLDEHDAVLGNGLCLSASGKCTLRAAMQQADALGGTNTINVPAGTYAISLGPIYTFNTTNVLTINGDGSWLETIIDGGNASQIFSLQGGQATLNNLVLQNGRFVVASQGAFGVCVGAAIFVRGSGAPAIVTVNGSVIVDNEVVNGSGGGVCVTDATTFNLVDSTVANNLATYGRAGIRNTTGTVNIGHSTISGNQTANGPSAGIQNQSVLTIVNSTVSGNVLPGASSNPQNLTTDQRGPGYPRSWNNVTDIGAYQTGAGGPNSNEWVRRAYIAYYGRPPITKGWRTGRAAWTWRAVRWRRSSMPSAPRMNSTAATAAPPARMR